MKKKPCRGFCAVVLAASLLTGCGVAKPAAVQKEEALTVYLWDTDLLTDFVPYIHEQLPDREIEIIAGCNDTDLYSYLQAHGELPDIMTVRRFSGTDAKDLQPYLLDFDAYDVVSEYSSYALQYYKNSEGSINWLPVCGIPQTIIANKTLFDQYGLELPQNYAEYAAVCQAFYDNGIKPYAMDLANDWSGHEAVQAGGIGEFTSLEGMEWRNAAESAEGEIVFDDAMWTRIFEETENFLRDSHFTEEDLGYGIDEAMQLFVDGKAAMFHGTPVNMKACQESMDAELARIPYFSQTADEGFVYMNPSLNVAMNKKLEEDPDKLETAMEVLNCMLSEEGQKRIANGSGIISFNPKIASTTEGMSGLEEQMRNNEYYIRYSAQKSFSAGQAAVTGLLTGEMDAEQAYACFRQEMNSGTTTEAAAAHFDNTYALSLNDKGGRDAASAILTTVREETGADLAFAPYYYFSTSIYAGDCSAKNVKRMVAYTPALYLESVSGADIKTMLETYLADGVAGFRPYSRYELPILSGMKLVIEDKNGFSVKEVFVNGKPIEEGKSYTLLLAGEAISRLWTMYPENSYTPLEDTSLSSAWTRAITEEGRQPAAPEDYMEIWA